MILLAAQAGEEQRTDLIARIRDLGGVVREETSGQVVTAAFPQDSAPNPGDFRQLPGVEAAYLAGERPMLSQRSTQPENTRIDVGEQLIGSEGVVIAAGPCAVESEEQFVAAARAVKAAGAHILRGGAFKPRTRVYSFQGLGEKGLRIMRAAAAEVGLPIVTEAMSCEQLDVALRYADIIQIGSRSMQNFPLLKAAGRMRKPVLLKRGFMCTVEEWLAAAEYILSEGNDQVILCERGTRHFDRETPAALDMLVIPRIKALSHLPLFVDPSHAAGRRDLVPAAALAAVAAGADGLLIEVHPRPEAALSDGPQQLTLESFADLVPRLRSVAEAVGRSIE